MLRMGEQKERSLGPDNIMEPVVDSPQSQPQSIPPSHACMLLHPSRDEDYFLSFWTNGMQRECVSSRAFLKGLAASTSSLLEASFHVRSPRSPGCEEAQAAMWTVRGQAMCRSTEVLGMKIASLDLPA